MKGVNMKYNNFIGGVWTPPASGEYIDLRSPADTSDIFGSFAVSGPEDVLHAVEAAKKAFSGWTAMSGPERGRILYRFADLLELNRQDLAETLSREEGKTLSESVGEVGRAAAETRFAAGEASRMTGNHFVSDNPDVEIFLKKIPIGPVAVITPWNFPIVTPVRKISPALAYGNTVVFKPPTITPLSAIRLVELYREAGVPDGVINLILGPGAQTGDALSSHPDIRGITFTGSTSIGKRIYANSTQNLTKVQLEMGGKNPALVYHAENLEICADEIVRAAFSSCGQRCTAISRVVVSEEEHDELVTLMAKKVAEITVGDPRTPGVVMGPLVSQAQIETCESYVKIAEAEGCRIAVGGKRVEGLSAGYYFEATLIDGVKRTSPLALEEIFGPILSVITVSSFLEGLEVCNDPEFGLAGCVFSSEVSKAKKFISDMDSGMVHVNHGTASQAHVPFGGMKSSGFGAFSIGPTNSGFYTKDKVVYLK